MSDNKVQEGRAIPWGYRMVPKSMPVRVSTGSERECSIANLSGIPYDYVPPPENINLMTVPFKWPKDEEWTRIPDW
jgi:hypothetical protein